MADQVSVADGVAHAPPGCVERFADGADTDGVAGDGGIEGCDTGKRSVEGEMLVDFVGEDDDVVASAQGTDGEELGRGEDFAEGVVAGLFAYVRNRKKQKRKKEEGEGGRGSGSSPGTCSIWGSDLRRIHNLGP